LTCGCEGALRRIEKPIMYQRAENVLKSNQVQEGDTINPYNEILNNTGISPTLTTRPEGNKTAILAIVKECENTLAGVMHNYRIRKLTERECFRLMGVCEEYIDLIQAAGISRSQQYKMAGNSIVVDVLVAIFRQLLIGNKNAYQQLEIF
jgi:site-specific DNA-cytosine methylase